ncbi:MAG: hypothetical protein IKI76_07295 [Selenomonadaceae bacterium]|nr:hypothetical protein [Selenomonadaceae bacterium]
MGILNSILRDILRSDSGQAYRAISPEMDRFAQRNEQRVMIDRIKRDEQRRQQRQQQNQPNAQQNDEGCFITTAVCGSFGKADDCYELTTFRKFRDGWLSVQPDGKSLIAEYYVIAPRIVDKINRLTDAPQIYEGIWQKYLEPCLTFINSGDNLSCKNKYVEMVRELKRKYLQ